MGRRRKYSRKTRRRIRRGKWGKIGAPHSAKRKKFLAKLRRKR